MVEGKSVAGGTDRILASSFSNQRGHGALNYETRASRFLKGWQGRGLEGKEGVRI